MRTKIISHIWMLVRVRWCIASNWRTL